MDSSYLRQMDLTVDAVYPDKWNKMRVTHAKSVFSLRTLNHGMAKYASILNCGAKVAGIKVDTNEENKNGICMYTTRVNTLV